MKHRIFISAALLLWVMAKGAVADISIHTEIYPRPPYSGATYYFYTQRQQVICTKLEVCNKFAECTVAYKAGKFREEEDLEPFDKTAPVLIAPEKLKKHRCLTQFKLLP